MYIQIGDGYGISPPIMFHRLRKALQGCWVNRLLAAIPAFLESRPHVLRLEVSVRLQMGTQDCGDWGFRVVISKDKFYKYALVECCFARI